MEFPLSDFNLRDLLRELYGYALSTEGTQQELHDRLMAARHEEAEAQAQGFVRPGRPPITKYEACVQPDDFAEIECMTDEEYNVFSKKVHWRLRRIHKTYNGDGLEYYHPGVLHQIDRSKTYSLNMTEFWVRQKPFIHKMFVIFVSRTNGEEQRLCYARSFAKVRRPNMSMDQIKTPIITNAEIGRTISNILLEIEENGLENYVAIITDKNKVSMKALSEVLMVSAQRLPQIVLDDCHLQKTFQNMFCSKSARCLSELKNLIFDKNTYLEQLSAVRKNYTQNVDADNLLKEYTAALPKVLQNMWKIEEHRDKPISLARLNNERLNSYGEQVQNDLPPITFEECTAGGGLLQLILFDALWCLCNGHEIEEDFLNRSLDPPVSEEWMSILN